MSPAKLIPIQNAFEQLEEEHMNIEEENSQPPPARLIELPDENARSNVWSLLRYTTVDQKLPNALTATTTIMEIATMVQKYDVKHVNVQGMHLNVVFKTPCLLKRCKNYPKVLQESLFLTKGPSIQFASMLKQQVSARSQLITIVLIIILKEDLDQLNTTLHVKGFANIFKSTWRN
ncbi:hypothetical protein CEXT_523331 [Caerostris extrusa]|uniref:Uncharacterized protein n=1 Tax=Caerostris extrusa TaxID=172846 RepID=A0AAV4NSU4_CAEEX|nr:hypothetical protein CEXT_523331 [Caerostris extrusa]